MKCAACVRGDHLDCVDWAPAGDPPSWDHMECDCSCEELVEQDSPDPEWASNVDSAP